MSWAEDEGIDIGPPDYDEGEVTEAEERRAWDMYAAAAMHLEGYPLNEPFPKWVAELADQMLAERRKRFPIIEETK